MATKLPLVYYDGVVEEIHTGDTLDATFKAGGSSGQVQYNSSDILTGSANLTFNGTDLTVTGTVTATNIGTIASQAANSVAITGGSISGITDLAVADGGTGSSTAQAAINTLTAVSGASAGDVLTKSGSNASWAAPVTGSRHVIKNNAGTSMDDRASLKFADGSTSTITVTDDSGNNQTIVTLAASATPTASIIPIANGSGKLAEGWLTDADTVPTKGIVALTNSYTGTSESLAATQYCVKDAFDNIDTSTQLVWSIVFGG